MKNTEPGPESGELYPSMEQIASTAADSESGIGIPELEIGEIRPLRSRSRARYTTRETFVPMISVSPSVGPSSLKHNCTNQGIMYLASTSNVRYNLIRWAIAMSHNSRQRTLKSFTAGKSCLQAIFKIAVHSSTVALYWSYFLKRNRTELALSQEQLKDEIFEFYRL